MIGILKRLIGSHSGAALTEFALIAPLFMMMLMGFFDLCRTAYVRSVLQGAIQKAGRDGTLETPDLTELNASVEEQVRPIVGQDATFTPKWQSYSTFSSVNQPEPLSDTNGNQVRDPGECYQDENGNGTWDADVGLTGSGSASDVVLYSVTVSYPRIFPMNKGAITPVLRAPHLLRYRPERLTPQDRKRAGKL